MVLPRDTRPAWQQDLYGGGRTGGAGAVERRPGNTATRADPPPAKVYRGGAGAVLKRPEGTVTQADPPPRKAPRRSNLPSGYEPYTPWTPEARGGNEGGNTRPIATRVQNSNSLTSSTARTRTPLSSGYRAQRPEPQTAHAAGGGQGRPIASRVQRTDVFAAYEKPSKAKRMWNFVRGKK